MRSTTKRRSTLSASNAARLEELCAWIVENPMQTLGWSQLTQRSGYSKEQLIELFQVYKQLTPFAFIRQVRQQQKKNQETYSQPELFESIAKLVNDSDRLI
jgi:AraC-like DNA-binding protein